MHAHVCVQVAYILVYPLLGLQGNFIMLVGAAWALGIASSSVAVVLGCSVPDVKAVAELAPAVFVPQMLFAGFFVRISQIPTYLRWAQYLCALKYCLNLIMLIEFNDCGSNSASPEIADMACDNLLEQNDVVKEGEHVSSIQVDNKRTIWWTLCSALQSLFTNEPLS